MPSIKSIERVYYFVTILFWFATGLPLALFVLFIRSRGINLFETGLLMGIYSLVIVVLEVPTGGLADAVGRKKVALLAYLIGAISLITFFYSFGFLMILSGFILMGIGRALASGSLDAWFVDALQSFEPDIDLQPLFSKAGTLTMLALGIGTLVGSTLPNLFSFLPPDGTAVLTPLAMPGLAALIVQLALIVSTKVLVQESLPDNQAGQWKQGIRQVPEIIKTGFSLSRANPIIVLLLGIGVASGVALTGMESFWQPHFAQLLGGAEGNSYYFGIIMGGNFIVGMLGNMLATQLSKLLRKQYALVGTIFQGLWGLMLIALASVTLPVPAMIVFWLVYLSMGVTNSPYQTLLNQEIPSEQRSAMLSIASLFSYLGGMLGGVLLGLVAENISITLSWQIAGFVLVLSLILFWKIHILSSKKDHLVTFPANESIGAKP